MTDQAACAGMSLGPAQVSVAALNELRAVLTEHSTPPSLLESSEEKRQENSDETIAKDGKRPVHPGASARTKAKRSKAMNPKITPEHLRRGAIVYVRQSSIGQVVEHTESKRRQYALADWAREMGFLSVSVIDDDLGRSGSGLVERPGFQKLVAAACAGSVGLVFCIEASRLARNGRDWHHLIDLCARDRSRREAAGPSTKSHRLSDRMAGARLSHCGSGPETPEVRRGVRVWPDDTAYSDHRRRSPEEPGAPQAPGGRECFDSGASSWLHHLGTVRGQSEDVERERAHAEEGGPQIRPRRPGLVERLGAGAGGADGCRTFFTA